MGSGCDRYIEMMSWADGYNVGECLLPRFPPTNNNERNWQKCWHEEEEISLSLVSATHHFLGQSKENLLSRYVGRSRYAYTLNTRTYLSSQEDVCESNFRLFFAELASSERNVVIDQLRLVPTWMS